MSRENIFAVVVPKAVEIEFTLRTSGYTNESTDSLPANVVKSPDARHPFCPALAVWHPTVSPVSVIGDDTARFVFAEMSKVPVMSDAKSTNATPTLPAVALRNPDKLPKVT